MSAFNFNNFAGRRHKLKNWCLEPKLKVGKFLEGLRIQMLSGLESVP